jgi:hypothetical protein
VIAEQDERIASERVEDVPSVDELLVAELSTGGVDERSLPSSPCPGRLLGATLIHPSAWKRGILGSSRLQAGADMGSKAAARSAH